MDKLNPFSIFKGIEIKIKIIFASLILCCLTNQTQPGQTPYINPNWKVHDDGSIDPATVFPWPDRPGYSLADAERDMRERYEKKFAIPPIITTLELPNGYHYDDRTITQNPTSIRKTTREHAITILHEIGHSKEPPESLISILIAHYNLNARYNPLIADLENQKRLLSDKIIHMAYDPKFENNPKFLLEEIKKLQQQRDAIDNALNKLHDQKNIILNNAYAEFLSTLPEEAQRKIKANPSLKQRTGEYWADRYVSQHLTVEELGVEKKNHLPTEFLRHIKTEISRSHYPERQKKKFIAQGLQLYYPGPEQEKFDPDHPAPSERYEIFEQAEKELKQIVYGAEEIPSSTLPSSFWMQRLASWMKQSQILSNQFKPQLQTSHETAAVKAYRARIEQARAKSLISTRK